MCDWYVLQLCGTRTENYRKTRSRIDDRISPRMCTQVGDIFIHLRSNPIQTNRFVLMLWVFGHLIFNIIFPSFKLYQHHICSLYLRCLVDYACQGYQYQQVRTAKGTCFLIHKGCGFQRNYQNINNGKGKAVILSLLYHSTILVVNSNMENKRKWNELRFVCFSHKLSI